MRKYEYCIMDEKHNNIDCSLNLKEAIKMLKEYNASEIWKVYYGENEDEIGFEVIWD